MCALYLTLAEFQILLTRQSINTLGKKEKRKTNTNTQKKIMPRLVLFKRTFN